MKKIILFLISILTLLCCNRTDFSNPEDVIEKYRILTLENSNEEIYNNFLSSKSKEFITLNEFIKFKEISDTIDFKIINRNIKQLEIDVNKSSYRRFYIEEKMIEKNDTVYYNYYYTLINENGKWKLIWTSSLEEFAINKFKKSNYIETRNTLNKIIEINPFNGFAYSLLAWSYFRDESLSNNERENGIVQNAKYALTLEENNFEHYNTLASYYSGINNQDLAIKTYKRGLEYCKNKQDKTKFYSNIALCYLSKKDYFEAENNIKESIKISNNEPFTYYVFGLIMQEQNKNQEAIVYFKKALSESKMDNALQARLYYYYSISCSKASECEKAQEYINKALDLEPENKKFQNYFNKIKDCSNNNLNFLLDYNKKYPYEVNLFENTILKQRIIQLIGNELFEVMKDICVVESPIIVEDNIFYANGCMQHGCPFTNYILIFDSNLNNLEIGIKNDPDIKVFSENNLHSEKLIEWQNQN